MCIDSNGTISIAVDSAFYNYQSWSIEDVSENYKVSIAYINKLWKIFLRTD